MKRLIWWALAVWCILGTTAFAGDSTYIGIDLTEIAFPTIRGVEPSPFILWRNALGQHFARIMTIDHFSGARLGEINVPLSAVAPGVDIMWAEHFSLSPNKGFEPTPFIVFENFSIMTFPVSYGVDGTPAAGPVSVLNFSVDPLIYGHATAIGEMPGEYMVDQLPRLVIGTSMGFIVMVRTAVGAGPYIEDIFPITEDAIDAIEILPRYLYMVLGVLAGNKVIGLDFTPPPGKGTYAYVFTLTYTGAETLTDFTCPQTKYGPLPDRYDTLDLIFADGMAEVGASRIGPMLYSEYDFDAIWRPEGVPIRAVCSGSLLMLSSDSAAVMYDPVFTPENGPGSCAAEISNPDGGDCAYIAGDANGDGLANVGDVVYLINYVFKGGAAPYPLESGDANGDCAVNVGDAVYIINFVFNGGPDPVLYCSM